MGYTALSQRNEALALALELLEEHRDAFRTLQNLDEMEKSQYISRMARAAIGVGLGDKDKAFEWLEKAFQERSDALAGFRKDLQSDPRFAELRKSLGLGK